MGKELKVPEVAELLNVEYRSVLRYIKSGQLPAWTLPGGDYRVNEDDLRRFKESAMVEAPAGAEAKE